MMKIEIEQNKSAIFWFLQIACWFCYFLYVLLVFYSNLDGSRLKIILWIFFLCLPGFFLSLLLRQLYKKIDYKTRSIFFLSATVLFGSFVASHVWLGLDQLLNLIFHSAEDSVMPLTFRNYVWSVFLWSLILISWSSFYLFINFWTEWKFQRDRAEKADVLAQNAQLQMLKHQLNPHFLFNSLNSIRALIEEDESNATEMVTQLSEFLQYSLACSNYSGVPLKTEIEAVRQYLAIEKKRYEDKLQIEYEIDPAAENYPVLSFLVHPLVENAVKYGMKTSPMPLRIGVKANVKGSTLNLEVWNTGRWIAPQPNNEKNVISDGSGLDNMQNRLTNAYGGNHRFEVKENDGKVHIVIEIKTKSGIRNGKRI